MSDPRRVFTATAIIGPSGSGKTSLLETFAEYLWETHQKVLLLYSVDGGAIPTGVQKRMHQGLIRFWRMRTRSAMGLGLETMMLATKGYWPKAIDPRTGETTPAVELVAPVTTTYSVSCPDGHLMTTVPSLSLVRPGLCPVCRTMVDKATLKVVETSARTKGFEAVGGVAYDGLTAMCAWVLDEMDRMRGHGDIGGEKSSFGGTITSGNQKIGGNNRADVGFAQTRAHQYVNNSLSIPYLVEGPVFTCLTMETTDEGNLPIVGFKLSGSAAADVATSWFGNVMETAKTKDDSAKERHTLYLRPFTDKEGRRHLLKSSGSPFGIPSELHDPTLDLRQPFRQFNLGYVFKLLDADLKDSLKEAVPNAPGMPEGIVEYGEPATVTTPATPAAPRVPTAPPAAPVAPKPAAPSVAGPSRTPPPPAPRPPQRAPGK